MQGPSQWQGLPYHPISLFYKEKFGQKVYKVPVATAETCPNREGLRGMQTCNFCDVWGSSAFEEYQPLPLKDQIELGMVRVKKRVNAGKFLVYFQAYTTTFGRVSKLRESFELATSYPEVVGIVVGTRPDCISDGLFELWNEYNQKVFLSVEFGVQSFNEHSLVWMRRGHTAKKSVEAILRTRQNCATLDLGIHLMFGLPNESDHDIILSAKTCNSLPIDNVKLHNLHVLKNTPLADDFAKGEFVPVTLEEYTRKVTLFLEHLDPRISVHRLAAVSSRPDELVAPAWVGKRMDSYQYVLDVMNAAHTFQGRLCAPTELALS
jgi:radical SAM protein (TIGR01212 family)